MVVPIVKIFFKLIIILLSWTPVCLADDYCFEKAGELYGISPQLLAAISLVESNHVPDALNINKNGSTDYGHMQINSLWVSVIGDAYLELDDRCFCTQVGAYILSGCIEKHGYNSDAISCYNSGRPIKDLKGATRQRVIGYVRRVESRYMELKQ